MVRLCRIEYGKRESELHEENTSKISKDFVISLHLSMDLHMHVRKLPRVGGKNHQKRTGITRLRAQIGSGRFCVSTSQSGKTSKCKGERVEYPETFTTSGM